MSSIFNDKKDYIMSKSLREEFEAEVSKAYSGVEFLIRTNNQYYINWLEQKLNQVKNIKCYEKRR